MGHFCSQRHIGIHYGIWHYAAVNRLQSVSITNGIKPELFIVLEKCRYLLLLTINAMLYDTYNLQGRASLRRLSGTKVSNIKGLATFKM